MDCALEKVPERLQHFFWAWEVQSACTHGNSLASSRILAGSRHIWPPWLRLCTGRSPCCYTGREQNPTGCSYTLKDENGGTEKQIERVTFYIFAFRGIWPRLESNQIKALTVNNVIVSFWGYFCDFVNIVLGFLLGCQTQDQIKQTNKQTTPPKKPNNKKQCSLTWVPILINNN